jgi:hypothetical protein
MDRLEGFREEVARGSLMLQATSKVGIKIDRYTSWSAGLTVSAGWQWVKTLCDDAVEHWEPEAWADDQWEWAGEHGCQGAEFAPSTREAFTLATEVELWNANVDPPIEESSGLDRIIYSYLDETGRALVHAVGTAMAELWQAHDEEQ